MADNPYKNYFEMMPAYLTILDHDLRIVEENQRFRQDFGDCEGRYCFQINQHRSERCEHCPVERTFRDGLPHRIEEKFLNHLGSEVFLLICTTPITNDAGEITHVMKMAADITEIKLQQNQILDSRERYRQLFEEVPCYISIQDPDLRIVEANRRLREDFGALPGGKCHQTYMHRTEACVPCVVRQTFEDGQVHQSEEVMTSQKGDHVNVLVYTAPVRDEKGQIRNVIEMGTNITQIRQLQSQLTSLGLIISSISHGIKGLLTSLDGGVYLVNTGLAKNDRARFEQGWKMVERNITRVRRMVLDLLYYAKDRVPELEKIPALAVAEEVCEVMRGKAAEIGIDFRWETDRNPGDLEADSKAIRSLLVNLVENAIDACRVDKKKAAHQVRIGLKGYPEYIEFEVEDNGIGMDQEIRERAFSLFFLQKEAAERAWGLFISNKISQAHGGEIKIESELNKGTRMIRKTSTEASGLGDAGTQHLIKEGCMSGRKRILIVDDEADIRTYLSTLLEDQGYETAQAKDGAEAMQKVQAGPPDLITLDVSMPEKSGVKFFREMKTDDRWRHIPVIIVTGVSEDFKKFITSRHQVPAPEGFVSKPINQEEILDLVHSLIK